MIHISLDLFNHYESENAINFILTYLLDYVIKQLIIDVNRKCTSSKQICERFLGGQDTFDCKFIAAAVGCSGTRTLKRSITFTTAIPFRL